MRLLEAVLEQIPHVGLLQRPETTLDSGDGYSRPFDFACAFFKIPDRSLSTWPPFNVSTMPHASCLESLVSMSKTYTECLKESQQTVVLRESFSRTLALINNLVERLTTPVNLTWNPKEWIDVLLLSLEYEVRVGLILNPDTT